MRRKVLRLTCSERLVKVLERLEQCIFSLRRLAEGAVDLAMDLASSTDMGIPESIERPKESVIIAATRSTVLTMFRKGAQNSRR